MSKESHVEKQQTWIAGMWDGIAARREAQGDHDGAERARLSADTFRATARGLASRHRY